MQPTTPLPAADSRSSVRGLWKGPGACEGGGVKNSEDAEREL
jgi:hypothetical protein